VTWLPWIGLGLLLVLVVLLIIYRERLLNRENPIPRDHHMSALEALADGDEKVALGELQHAIQNGQGGVDAYLRLAEIYRAHGQLKKATQLHRSLAANQGWSESVRRRILRGLSEDYLQAGRWEEALQNLESLRKIDGRDASVMRRISQVHLRKGDGDKALSSLKRAHRLEEKERPDELAILLAELAKQQIGDQKWGEARKSLQEAMKYDPQSLSALRQSIDLYVHEGKEQEAADEIQKLAMTGESGSETIYEAMEKHFFDLGRFHEIQFVYQEVISKSPSFWPARFALGSILDKRGRRDEAVKLMDLSQPADDAEAAMAAARLLAWGEPNLASQWLERWSGDAIKRQQNFRCRHCGSVYHRSRYYCPACHGFKSYEPIRNESSALAAG
jgi:lipopolysaccharide biosynthesis regulator YciM